MSLSSTLRQLIHFFLTPPCPICQRSASEILCTDCHRQILGYSWSGSTQGNTLGAAGTLALPNNTALPVFAWGQYRGLLKQTLALLKYGNQDELGNWLGFQLGQYWLRNGYHKTYHPQPVVIPIPLHNQKLQQRGYNQAALIAKGFCRVTGLALAEHGLIRTKATSAMYTLDAQDRQKNLANAFQLGTALPTTLKPILIIDDIYTTGATAHAATIPLVKAGYNIIGITTVARSLFSRS
ncbi:ComF family protein [Leptothoe spongobia]|uniref:ComF family protein n=1 Tax=Leptothoe spongobia TAU-MAC 1115 TaxID=1967444 RepID=A0A947GIY3_9CYAN|nr:ComF family protein [Leptothoe spongobia]MBT9316555.1 ComF family protein [Leptothoe spongobia TAU-MAC 1115]